MFFLFFFSNKLHATNITTHSETLTQCPHPKDIDDTVLNTTNTQTFITYLLTSTTISNTDQTLDTQSSINHPAAPPDLRGGRGPRPEPPHSQH